MAKKKDVVLADSVKDPETGKLIHFSEEEKRDLLFCERQMKVGFMQIAIALKTIRDRRLYLLRECDSMRAYVEEYVQFSYRHAHRLMHLADTFGDAKTDLLESFSQDTLLAIAQNPAVASDLNGADVVDGEVRLPDGEVLPLEEFTARIRREIQRNAEKKEDKLQRRIDTIAAEVKTKNEALAHYERLIADGNEREKRLEETIESLSVRKDLDAHILAYITHKNDAVRLIADCTPAALELLGRVDGIPRDLVDAELAGQVSFFLAAIETAVTRIRESFRPFFWIPGETERPDDVVPR